MIDNKKKYDNLDISCKQLDTVCLPESSLPRIIVIGGGFAGLALVEKTEEQRGTGGIVRQE